MTLRKPYFAQRRSPDQRAAALALLDTHATLTDLSVEVAGIAPDPDDDHVLAAAASVEAEYLVTGDRPLQTVGTFGNTEIVSPRRFLEILNTTR